MLEIFLCGENYVEDNASYFASETFDRVFAFTDKNLLYQIIKEIDNCSLDYNTKLVSNQLGINQPLTKLSLGCQTALNVLLNPDKIFFGHECGDNAFDLILLLDGKIRLSWLPYSDKTYDEILYRVYTTPTNYEDITYKEAMHRYGTY